FVPLIWFISNLRGIHGCHVDKQEIKNTYCQSIVNCSYFNYCYLSCWQGKCSCLPRECQIWLLSVNASNSFFSYSCIYKSPYLKRKLLCNYYYSCGCYGNCRCECLDCRCYL